MVRCAPRRCSLMLLALTCAAALAAEPVETEAREILDQLLRVDTSHGNETAALRPLLARFERAGVQAQLLEAAPGRGNLIARVRGTGAKRPLLLLAHIDVVPVEGQPWSVPAFQPTQKDGYLYARGVSDDKAMASAFSAIALEIALRALHEKLPLSDALKHVAQAGTVSPEDD